MNRFVVLALAGVLVASGADLDQAQHLFKRAQYDNVIAMLRDSDAKDAKAQFLLGKSYFVIGEYKKATDAFDRALAVSTSSEYENWMGKAYGRRAETSNPLMAPGYATKARQHFERAVALDGRNSEAINDLISYYIEAPGFLGGGIDKAQALAGKLKSFDEAEYHYQMAQIDEQRKDARSAEAHLRAAINLAPTQVGRVIDLARFLSKQGRTDESEQTFLRAEKISPNEPRLLFERARNLIRAQSNLPVARQLLQKYMTMPHSPDDPSREEAVKLLKSAGA